MRSGLSSRLRLSARRVVVKSIRRGRKQRQPSGLRKRGVRLQIRVPGRAAEAQMLLAVQTREARLATWLLLVKLVRMTPVKLALLLIVPRSHAGVREPAEVAGIKTRAGSRRRSGTNLQGPTSTVFFVSFLVLCFVSFCPSPCASPPKRKTKRSPKPS